MDTQAEVWVPVRGAAGYEVSDLGRVRSVARVMVRSNGAPMRLREKILRPIPTMHGYHVVTLSLRGVHQQTTIHKLVAYHFLGPANATEVNHKNCDKTDNRAVNLEWATHDENMRHASLMGRLSPVTNPRRSNVLNLEMARGIRAMHRDGMSVASIARTLGISYDLASSVANGRSWVGCDNATPVDGGNPCGLQ